MQHIHADALNRRRTCPARPHQVRLVPALDHRWCPQGASRSKNSPPPLGEHEFPTGLSVCEDKPIYPQDASSCCFFSCTNLQFGPGSYAARGLTVLMAVWRETGASSEGHKYPPVICDQREWQVVLCAAATASGHTYVSVRYIGNVSALPACFLSSKLGTYLALFPATWHNEPCNMAR